MRKLLIFALILPACVFAGSIGIPIENTIILRIDYPYKSTWMPSQSQAQEALAKTLYFIEHPSGVNDWQKSEITKIKKDISSYKVQFAGIEIDGKKRIWCNFFRGISSAIWKQGVVLVRDGGFWYWQIEYDLETESCVNFRSNGYA